MSHRCATHAAPHHVAPRCPAAHNVPPLRTTLHRSAARCNAAQHVAPQRTTLPPLHTTLHRCASHVVTGPVCDLSQQPVGPRGNVVRVAPRWRFGCNGAATWRLGCNRVATAPTRHLLLRGALDLVVALRVGVQDCVELRAHVRAPPLQLGLHGVCARGRTWACARTRVPSWQR
jgi:hypothetical protein